MDIKRNGSQPSHGFGVTLTKLVAATIISFSLLASASFQTSGQDKWPDQSGRSRCKDWRCYERINSGCAGNQCYAQQFATTGDEASRKLHWFLRRRIVLAAD
jgi:hypothetical protein